MLDKERIKEAEANVRLYLRDGLLKKSDFNKNVTEILISNAKESLRAAEEINQKDISDLWVIVCSYYSMYYYANAVLVKFDTKLERKLFTKLLQMQ